MELIFFIIQIIVSILLVLVILIQKTSNDGLAGLGSGSNNIMSSKASANILTKITTVLAILFMANSLILARLATHTHKSSIFDSKPVSEKNLAVDKKSTNNESNHVPLAE